MEICQDIKKIVDAHLDEIISLRNTRQLKPDGTFVSKGDLLSQTIIVDYLQRQIPNALIISEERTNSLSEMENHEFIITIDPIDGTENFVSGMKEWGIGICVYKNGRHFQSMLYMPELDCCLITGDKIQRRTDSRICGIPSYMKPDDFASLDRKYEYRLTGCCMYNMYNVITGSFCRFRHLTGCYSWDLLPGLNLALEHNLHVEINGNTYAGEFLEPGKKFKVDIQSC